MKKDLFKKVYWKPIRTVSLWYLNQDSLSVSPIQLSKMETAIQTGITKNTRHSLPKFPFEELLSEAGHFLSCSNCCWSSEWVWPRGGNTFLLFIPLSWNRGSTIATTLLRILGPWSLLPQFVRQRSHAGRNKPRRPEVTHPHPLSKQLLKWGSFRDAHYCP